MYSIVLATVLTSGTAAPDFFFRKGCHGCHGCWGGHRHGCWGGCYGGCWGGCWGGCYGGGWGGCWGGCYGGCWGGCCHGCYGGWGYGGCCGSCYGGCYGGWGGYGHGWHGCWGGYCHGWYGGYQHGGHGGYVRRYSSNRDSDTDNDRGKKTDGDEETDGMPATVVVKAPRDVVVSFDGRETKRNAEEETFETPDLRPGRAYAYEVKAEAVRDGKKVTRSKQVIVRAGRRVTVDFRDIDRAAVSAER